MSIYGYCRISTPKQNIERQRRNIEAIYPTAKIYEEVYSGTRFQGRAKLNQILKQIKSNDTIIFDSVSRMSRNADEGFSLYEQLYKDGVNLVFLKEPHINTDTYSQAQENQVKVALDSGDKDANDFMTDIINSVNKYIMRLAQKQIQLAFEQSEKEVTDLQQRTKEGIDTAKRNGKQIGHQQGTKLTTKKSIAAKAKIKEVNYSFDGKLSNEDTWKLVGISRMTFYKYKGELIEEINNSEI